MAAQQHKTIISIQGPASHLDHADELQEMLSAHYRTIIYPRVFSRVEVDCEFVTRVEFEHEHEDPGELSEAMFFFLLGRYGYQAQMSVSSATVEE